MDSLHKIEIKARYMDDFRRWADIPVLTLVESTIGKLERNKWNSDIFAIRLNFVDNPEIGFYYYNMNSKIDADKLIQLIKLDGNLF